MAAMVWSQIEAHRVFTQGVAGHFYIYKCGHADGLWGEGTRKKHKESSFLHLKAAFLHFLAFFVALLKCKTAAFKCKIELSLCFFYYLHPATHLEGHTCICKSDQHLLV
jgi:hypothetical protein